MSVKWFGPKNIDSVMRDIERAGMGGLRIVVDMDMHANTLYSQPYSADEQIPKAPAYSDSRRIGVFSEPVSEKYLAAVAENVYDKFWYCDI
jgi:hypothetical protein